MSKSAIEWSKVLASCGVKPATAALWAPHFASEVNSSSFSKGWAEIDDFLGQVLHESAMLETTEENLNYSVDGLLNGFGRHRISEADARRLGRINGQRAADRRGIANCIYGGPWGRKNLGNTEPGDGWDMRGSGLIQVTGRANLTAMAKLVGWKDPRALAEALRTDKREALRVSVLWWEDRIPDAIMGNVEAITKRVNGGDKGLEHRRALARAADLADGVLDGVMS